MFASALAFLCLCASASTFAPQPCMSRSGVCSGALSPCLPAGAISAARPSAATMRMQDSGEKQELSRERRALLQTAAAAQLLLWGGHPLPQPVAAEGVGERVLVVGASGGIGQYAMFELLDKGYKVRGVTRREKSITEQVKGTPLEQVEWVHGDLNDKSTLSPAMQGVKKVIFCAGAHGWEDIENNRCIYFEAVAELARLGALQGVDRYVLVSSAGLKRPKPNYSGYLKDVLKWKLKGEQALQASGVPYSIVRAYSLDNEKDDLGEDFTVAIFQGDPDGVGTPTSAATALITRKDLGAVTVEAMVSDKTKNASFEVCNTRKMFMGIEPDWRKALAAISPDPPMTAEDIAALKAAIASDQQALTNDAIKDKAFYGDPSNGFRN